MITVLVYSTWADSSEEDDPVEMSEEEQEQLLAETLRENRELEVKIFNIIRTTKTTSYFYLKGEKFSAAKANCRNPRNLLELSRPITCL